MAAILVIDEDVGSHAAVLEKLLVVGHAATAAASLEEARSFVARHPVDVVVLTLAAADAHAFEFCEELVANRPDMPVIAMSSDTELEVAIGAIRAGAYDFLRRPASASVLLTAVARAVRRRTVVQRINALPEHAGTPSTDGIVAESAGMRRVLDAVHRVARTEASLLISGASGTGKELLARALHRNSSRHARPFVTINCAALPETLLESELFGHVKGAFNDARQAHDGLFHQAEGGTFFLDEIADLPLGLQPKLLRALQERAVRPVGSNKEFPVNVRIVTATNQNLLRAVEEKRFRSDLFFRVNVVQVDVPELRTRGTDVVLLARHFLEHLATRADQPVRTLSPAAIELLLSYRWPGNVRELQNCMQHAVALGRFDAIGPQDFPDAMRAHSPAVAPAPQADVVTLRDVELRHVHSVLAMVDGNKSTAARLLGIDRKTLYRKLADVS